jgi:endonuclease/exonuclease/phosphatase (EEP) superfamily protein YafD
MVQTLIVALSALVVGATVLPLVRSTAWWIRVLDFPRLQIAALGTGVAAGGLWTGTAVAAWAAAAAGAAVVVQLFRIWPYTRLAPRQVRSATRREGSSGSERLVLLVANILMHNRDAEPLVEIVRAESPDLLLLMEADAWWRDRMEGAALAYAHRVEHPQDNTYGMLFFSRLPLEHPSVEFLTDEDVPSVWASVRLPSGRRVRLVCLHPRPPRPDRLQGTEQRDAELLTVARRLGRVTDPTLVAGDLNDVAWSRTTRRFQRISGLSDPRRGRGLFNTFHADHALLRYPLDHVFVSSHFRACRFLRMPHVGSDHFPVLVEIELAG